MVNIKDLSDKGRKQTRRLKYEVWYYCTPNPEHENNLEEPQIIAKFRAYGDAWRYAQTVASGVNATLVLIRS